MEDGCIGDTAAAVGVEVAAAAAAVVRGDGGGRGLAWQEWVASFLLLLAALAQLAE